MFSIIIELQFTFYEKFPLTIKGINDSCDKNDIDYSHFLFLTFRSNDGSLIKINPVRSFRMHAFNLLRCVCTIETAKRY